MIDLTKDSYSLSDLQHNGDKLVQQLKKTGQPLALTVNGKVELIVQHAAAYQRLLDRVDRLEALDGIRRGLEDVQQGRTQPAEEAFEEIRQKYDIPRDK